MRSAYWASTVSGDKYLLKVRSRLPQPILKESVQIAPAMVLGVMSKPVRHRLELVERGHSRTYYVQRMGGDKQGGLGLAWRIGLFGLS